MADPIRVSPIHRPTGSLAPEYFEQVYGEQADPWDFERSPYEAAKYAATLDTLPRPCYRRALEPGCSIGVLTKLLAGRCQSLLATDVSAAALDQARVRCEQLPHVAFEQRDLLTAFPRGSFDLIVVSEVGYYFSAPDLEQVAAHIAGSLEIGGHLQLVHFLGETNYPLSGDAVHETFLSASRQWTSLVAYRGRFRLDLLERRGP